MIYLDYSATTPVSDEVLASFTEACKNFANPNSTHGAGIAAKELIDKSGETIARALGVSVEEIIYTSGSSESNNLAIQGYAAKHPDKKHIITTKFEHSSVMSPLGALQKKGYEIDFIETDNQGIIDLNNLESLLREDTLMVCTIAVNSEIGMIQPIDRIADLLNSRGICYLLDATQAIGKIAIDFSKIDMFSFSAHKIYGIKGVGCLVKKAGLEISPMIYGGKSTSKYRSGTPATQLIASLATAVDLAYRELDSHFDYVSELNGYLRKKISEIDGILINSSENCSPYIFNLSLPGHDAKAVQNELSEKEIYISTKSACSSNSSKSIQILTLYKDLERATSSIRISLSYLTSRNEVDIVVEELKKITER